MSRKEIENLINMKEEYEKIPVPARTELDIRRAIMKAKRENRRKENIYKVIKPVGLTAAAAMAAIIVLANSSQSMAYAMERIPIIGAISKVVTFRTYEDKSGNFEANVQVPNVEADDIENTDEAAKENIAKVNKSIEEYANEFIAMYEADLKAANGEGNFAVESSYDVVTDNEQYLTIRINTVLVMASGTQYVKTFTIDKLTGETLDLKAILNNDDKLLQAVSDNIMSQMREQMAADEMKAYFIDSDMPDTDFKGLTGEESFYLNEAGELVVTFNEYEVAPGYMGAVEFTIPSTITGDAL